MSQTKEMAELMRVVTDMNREFQDFLTSYGRGGFDPKKFEADFLKQLENALTDFKNQISQLDVVALSRRFSIFEQEFELRDQFLSDQQFKWESFSAAGSLADRSAIAVYEGIAGDDSLDVADPMALEEGKFYILTDGVNSEPVLLRSRHEKGRIRVMSALVNSYGQARLSRLSAVIDMDKQELRGPGFYTTIPLTFMGAGKGHIKYEGQPPLLEVSTIISGNEF